MQLHESHFEVIKRSKRSLERLRNSFTELVDAIRWLETDEKLFDDFALTVAEDQSFASITAMGQVMVLKFHPYLDADNYLRAYITFSTPPQVVTADPTIIETFSLDHNGQVGVFGADGIQEIATTQEGPNIVIALLLNLLKSKNPAVS